MNIKYFIANRQVKKDLCYIVGKGASLQYLSGRNFEEHCNIIALNESIVQVEKIIQNDPFEFQCANVFSMQKDGASPYHRNECQCAIHGHQVCPHAMVRPHHHSILLVHELESSDCMLDVQPRYTFNNEDYKLQWYSPSILSAINIARQLGAIKIVLLCFDSFTHNEHLTFNPAKDEMITTSNYTCQHDEMKKLLADIPHQFIKPTK